MKKYAQNSEIAWRSYEDEAVLVSPRDSRVMVLNSTGSTIWKALEHPRTIAECADILAEIFDIDEKTALRDTEDLIEELLKKDLVVEKDE